MFFKFIGSHLRFPTSGFVVQYSHNPRWMAVQKRKLFKAMDNSGMPCLCIIFLTEMTNLGKVTIGFLLTPSGSEMAAKRSALGLIGGVITLPG